MGVEILTLIHAGLGLQQAYVREYKVTVVSDSNNLSCGAGWEGNKRGQVKAERPGENAEMKALDDPTEWWE